MDRENFWYIPRLAAESNRREIHREISFESPLVFRSLQKSPPVVNIHIPRGRRRSVSPRMTKDLPSFVKVSERESRFILGRIFTAGFKLLYFREKRYRPYCAERFAISRVDFANSLIRTYIVRLKKKKIISKTIKNYVYEKYEQKWPRNVLITTRRASLNCLSYFIMNKYR